MTGKTITRPLTDAERTLVERYHNLIYRVMHDLHLGTEADTDLYGEAALGLILAAQRYLADESLQKYRFTTIAYSRIRNALLRQRLRERKQPQRIGGLLQQCGVCCPQEKSADLRGEQEQNGCGAKRKHTGRGKAAFFDCPHARKLVCAPVAAHSGLQRVAHTIEKR